MSLNKYIMYLIFVRMYLIIHVKIIEETVSPPRVCY
jgi:hypothetical protein